MTLPRVDSSWTLFLDRDGVLNRKIERGYVLNPAMLEVLPGVLDAIRELAGRMGRIVVVTNQRGVARGLMSRGDLEAVHLRLRDAVAGAGGRIDGIFSCTHDMQPACGCRKPDIGLGLQAKERFSEIDFPRSVLVGDSDSDIEFGRRLGMFTVRISPQRDRGAADLGCAGLSELCALMLNAGVP